MSKPYTGPVTTFSSETGSKSGVGSKPITFWIVEPNKFADSTYVITAKFLNLGYVKSEADLSISTLKRLDPIRQDDKDRYLITILMSDDMAKKFETFSSYIQDKQVLIKFGYQDLIAPRVGPVSLGRLVISCRSKADFESYLKFFSNLVE